MSLSEPFTQEQQDVLVAVNLSCTFLSFLGEFYLFYIFFFRPAIRSFSFKLIISLTLADFIYSVANLLSIFRYNQISCNIEGYLRNVGLLQCAIWVPAILLITRKQSKNFDPRFSRHYSKFVIFIWTFSLIPSTVVAISDFLGLGFYFSIQTVFCVLQPDAVILYAGDLPLVICMIISLILAIDISFILKRQRKGNEEYRSLFIYPLIMMILYIPSVFDTYMFWRYQGDYYWMTLLHITTARLGGFANIVIYGRRTISINQHEESMRKHQISSSEGLGMDVIKIERSILEDTN